MAKTRCFHESVPALIIPERSDRQGVVAYQTNDIGRRLSFFKPDEVVANLKSHSEIDLIDKFTVFLLDNNVHGNKSTEIDQNQTCPDFLHYESDIF